MQKQVVLKQKVLFNGTYRVFVADLFVRENSFQKAFVYIGTTNGKALYKNGKYFAQDRDYAKLFTVICRRYLTI